MRKPSLYRRLRQTLSEFLFVLFHWREYHDAVLTIHQPWYDIVEGSDMLYLSDRDNWRCKFCGCLYHYWADQQQHHPGCLWPRIEKIHPYYR